MKEPKIFVLVSKVMRAFQLVALVMKLTFCRIIPARRDFFPDKMQKCDHAPAVLKCKAPALFWRLASARSGAKIDQLGAFPAESEKIKINLQRLHTLWHFYGTIFYLYDAASPFAVPAAIAPRDK